MDASQKLLSRDEFREATFKRDRGICVFCSSVAVDAHHILDRRLFLDGGYYLNNGASVCEQHHLDCEMTLISVEQVRAVCKITKIVTPENLEQDRIYDKWGNEVTEIGTRIPGPLFYDEGVQKILRKGNVLGLFELDYENIIKYPRTPHLEGSRLQPGDTDVDQVPYKNLAGKYIVLEEKIDGANTGISFSGAGELLLQSRGHYLTGGGRENQFSLFKSWATCHEAALIERLEDRYIVYGEWMFAKHTIFYDQLEHLFLEFDVWDKQKKVFLSTAARRVLLAGLPIKSVPVLYEGIAPTKLKDLTSLLKGSTYQSDDWKESLYRAAEAKGITRETVEKQTLMRDGMEGGYIKIETEDETVGRLKWVRPDFLQTILDSGSHHRDRVLIENRLASGINIFDLT